MPSSARIAKPAWIQSSTDNRLVVVPRDPPHEPQPTARDTLRKLTQTSPSNLHWNMTVQASRVFLAYWSHVLLHTHN